MKNQHRGSEDVLDVLSYLPQKLLRLHGVDNMTEYVLYDLSHNSCFAIPRIAYFVDNPDFNCFKGVAGINHEEVCDINDPWQEQEQFTSSMQRSAFNNKVRSIAYESTHDKTDYEQQLLGAIAVDLGIAEAGYQRFSLKHGNHGVLLFDNAPHVTPEVRDILGRSACILGFCPVF